MNTRPARILTRMTILAATALAFTGWLLAHGGDNDEVPVATAPSPPGAGIVIPKEQQFALGMLTELVADRGLAGSVGVTGRIVPRTDAVADVVAPVAGRVAGGRLPQLGDRVSRGEVLFRIAQVLSPSERTALRVEQIRARAELDAAEREVSRLERLEGVVAGKQLVEATIRRDAARDGYRTISAQLDGNGGTVAVTAPISGVITSAAITAGETVDGTRAVYSIADLSKVWVRADLFEGDLARLQEGTHATITTPSYPGETFAAILYKTGSVVDSSSRTITALFAIDNPNGRLKLNMSASVAIAGSTHATVLSIPRSAIIESGARRIVFVHTAPEEFQIRDVVTGAASDAAYVEVRGGINEGERVVTSGSYQLKGAAGL